MFVPFDQRPATSGFVAYQAFSAIAATQTPIPQVDAWEHIESLIGPITSVHYVPDSRGVPRWLFARSGAKAFLGICGIQSVYMAQGLLAGWSNPPSPTDESGVNSFATEGVYEIYNYIDTLSEPISNLLLAGYSYGSVVAIGVLLAMRRRRGEVVVRTITYGPPKPGSMQLAQLLRPSSETTIVQYCTDKDPVCFMYPDSEQAPDFHSVVPGSISRVQNTYVHVTQLRQLPWNGDGWQWVDYPQNPVGTPQRAIVGWATGVDGWNTSGHHWSDYRQRLFLYWARYPDFREESLGHVTDAVDSGEIPMDVAQQVPTIAPPINSPGDGPLKPAVGPIPARAGAKRGGPYSVYWNDVLIATFKQASRARKLRNTLKRIATSYRQSDQFQTESLGDAIILQATLEATGQATAIR